MAQKTKNGMAENWVAEDSNLGRNVEAKQKLEQIKLQEIGKRYIRIPHPSIKNTFILKERI